MYKYLHLMTGISKFLECYTSVVGQQGYVEFEVCNLGTAIFRATIVCQSLEH